MAGLTNRCLNSALESMTTGLTLHLFTNERDPGYDPDTLDFDEPNGMGYQPIQLYEQDRTIADGKAQFDEVEFTFTGPAGNVWGFYTTNLRNDVTLTEKWDEPFEILREGDTIGITVIIGR